METRETHVVECSFARDVAGSDPETAADELPLVIRTDVATPQVRDVPHRHQDFFALYLVRQGRGTHVIDGTPYGVSRGDVYVMGLNVIHLYSSFDDLILDALYFTPEIFARETWAALAETPGFLGLFVEDPIVRSSGGSESGRWLHLSPEEYADAMAKLTELRAEWESGTRIGKLLTRGLFLRMLTHLVRLYAKTSVHRERVVPVNSAVRESTVAAAVRYMDERYAEPLRIEQLAAQVFLSPDRFTEVFAASMGRTPSDYLRHVRLERAKALLKTTETAIAEIGLQVGFGEAAYFTRVFRMATGMTPTQYRSQPGRK